MHVRASLTPYNNFPLTTVDTSYTMHIHSNMCISSMKQTRRELFEACKRSNNIIKQIRARHGYSTRQWAKKLQLPHSTLRKVEITQSNLNPYKTMARLYQLLPYEEWLELVLSFSPIDCYLEVDRDELSPLGRADTI